MIDLPGPPPRHRWSPIRRWCATRRPRSFGNGWSSRWGAGWTPWRRRPWDGLGPGSHRTWFHGASGRRSAPFRL